MKNTTDTAEKLALNHYHVNGEEPHIALLSERDRETFAKIEAACPAKLYRQLPDGTARFDYYGCLECGTCRVLDDDSVLEFWSFPKGGFGVSYRFG